MTFSAGTKRNSASRSTNFFTSQGHATRSTFTFSRVIQRILPSSPGLDGQVVEERHRVRLRPDADLARVRERRVLLLDHLLAVEIDRELLSQGLDLQRMPLLRRDLQVLPAELLSPPADD